MKKDENKTPIEKKQALKKESASSSNVKTRSYNRRLKSQAQRSRRLARENRNKILFTLISIVLSFTCANIGFWLRGNSDLMLKLGMATELQLENVNPGMTIVGNTDSSLAARFAEVEALINNYSINSYDFNLTTNALLNQFTDQTEDPNLRYFDPTRYELYIKENTDTSIHGIGVNFAEKDGQAFAADVSENSSAALNGVQPGDFVIAIDGDSSQKWSITEVNNFMEIAKDCYIAITWMRPNLADGKSSGYEYITNLKVNTYDIQNVTANLDGDVGYINLRHVSTNSDQLIEGSVRNLIDAGAKTLLLDLRDCSGGFLTDAINIVSMFQKSGTVVSIQTRAGKTSRMVSGKVITDLPLVVLINQNTSNVAEVMAASLQDSGRATLVGVKTQGKGSVQAILRLSFGGALGFTAAKCYTPRNNPIDNRGVTPNITTENSCGDDCQKTSAIDLARRSKLSLRG
ncbi:MAG: peptidase [Eggerthellaceae bacterium]|nr:peptidase [Eggerthellaceae bacterium]